MNSTILKNFLSPSCTSDSLTAVAAAMDAASANWTSIVGVPRGKSGPALPSALVGDFVVALDGAGPTGLVASLVPVASAGVNPVTVVATTGELLLIRPSAP